MEIRSGRRRSEGPDAPYAPRRATGRLPVALRGQVRSVFNPHRPRARGRGAASPCRSPAGFSLDLLCLPLYLLAGVPLGGADRAAHAPLELLAGTLQPVLGAFSGQILVLILVLGSLAQSLSSGMMPLLIGFEKRPPQGAPAGDSEP